MFICSTGHKGKTVITRKGSGQRGKAREEHRIHGQPGGAAKGSEYSIPATGIIPREPCGPSSFPHALRRRVTRVGPRAGRSRCVAPPQEVPVGPSRRQPADWAGLCRCSRAGAQGAGPNSSSSGPPSTDDGGACQWRWARADCPRGSEPRGSFLPTAPLVLRMWCAGTGIFWG